MPKSEDAAVADADDLLGVLDSDPGGVLTVLILLVPHLEEVLVGFLDEAQADGAIENDLAEEFGRLETPGFGTLIPFLPQFLGGRGRRETEGARHRRRLDGVSSGHVLHRPLPLLEELQSCGALAHPLLIRAA